MMSVAHNIRPLLLTAAAVLAVLMEAPQAKDAAVSPAAATRTMASDKPQSGAVGDLPTSSGVRDSRRDWTGQLLQSIE
jgi:hypothetical protein